jgi:RHS repeat-associated protein
MSQLKNIIRESSGRARLVVVGVALLLVLALLGSYYFLHPKENLIEPVHANEGPTMYTLTVSTIDNYGPDVANTVTLSPSGGVYADGTVVTLEPMSHNWTWIFQGWLGDLTGNADPATITMNEDKSVTGVFGASYALTTAASGSGTVTPATSMYFGNATVDVTATPAPGWSFSHWTGNLSGSDPTQSVVINNANKSVTGVFITTQYTLTPLAYSSSDGSGGTYSWSPGGTVFDQGTEITLTAVPNSISDFDYWGGDASGTNPATTIFMTSNKTVVPNFKLKMRTLTPVDPAGGTITWTPPGTIHPHGTVLTFTATPDPGYYFGNWTGSGPWSPNAGVSSATMTMDANKVGAAIFHADQTPPVITLIGVTPVTINQGDPYSDAGATATDDLDGDLTGIMDTAGYPFDTDVAGTHVITYTVTDQGNNTTQLTRTVIVNDIEPPVILLAGSNPLTVAHGSIYADAGGTVTDNLDTIPWTSVDIVGENVDTSVLGPHTITYNVTDAAGNAAAQVTRTVNVTDQSPPVITLIGDNPLTIEQGGEYNELSAIVTDNVDIIPSENIAIDASAVDTAIVATYLVTYNVSDAALNAATQVTRTVDVIPQSALSVMGDLSNPDNFAPVNHIQHMVTGLHGGLGPMTGFPDPTGTGSFQALQFPKTNIPGLREHHLGLAPAAADLAITAEGVTAQINPVQNSISLHEKDFEINTVGNLELVFHRTYVNPYGFHNDYYVNAGDLYRRNNTIGEGWTHSFNMHLRPSFDGGWLFFVDEHGNATEYELYDTVTDGLNWFQPATTNVTTASLGTYITHDSATSLYTLYLPGGFEYIFYGNATDQTYLQTIRDAADNEIQFHYLPALSAPKSAKLDKVTLPTGDDRFIQFGYTTGTGDLISQVTLENGSGVLKTVEYTHTANYLTDVTVNGISDDKVTYTYDFPVTPADGVYMSSITDRDENVYTFDFVYGTYGAAEGDHITVTYPNGLNLKLDRQVNNSFSTIQRDRGAEIFGGIRFDETNQERHLYKFGVNTQGQPVTGIWEDWLYTLSGHRDLVGIKLPTSPTDNVLMAYNNAGRLTSVQHLDGVTNPQWAWTYPTVNDVYPTSYVHPEFGLTNFYYVDAINKRLDRIEAPLRDNFEDGDTNGWIKTGTWNVVNGMAKNVEDTSEIFMMNPNTAADNELAFDYINHSTASGNPWNNRLLVEVRRRDWEDGYNQVQVNFAESSLRVYNIDDESGGPVITTLIDDPTVTSPEDVLFHVRIVTEGNSITIYRAQDGQAEQEVASYTGSSLTTLDTNYLYFYTAANAQFSLDNIYMSGDGAFIEESYDYDATGQVTTVTTHGTDTTYGYDAHGNITSVTEPLVGMTSYAYDELGNITSVTEPNLDTTTYAYADLLFPDKVTSITRPGGSPIETFYYDANGGLEKKFGHDGLGHYLMYYVYDDFNRVKAVYKLGEYAPVVPDATTIEQLVAGLSPIVELTYDALGRLTHVINIGFTVTDFEYDHMGRVTTRLRDYTDDHKFYYDYMGNITTVENIEVPASPVLIPYNKDDDPNEEVKRWTSMGNGPVVNRPKVSRSTVYGDERFDSDTKSRYEADYPTEEKKPGVLPSVSWTTDAITVSEGTDPQTQEPDVEIMLTAVLSEPSDEVIEVSYGHYHPAQEERPAGYVPATHGATADFEADTGVFTFQPGETTKQTTITVHDDTDVESNEHFSMFLAPFLHEPSNVISGDRQSLTIAIEDDGDGRKVYLDGGITQITEGETLEFKVMVDNPSPVPIEVDVIVDTVSSTALEGTDFTLSGAVGVTIPPWQSFGTFTVEALIEGQIDIGEDIRLVVANPTNATIDYTKPSLTIYIHDLSPEIHFAMESGQVTSFSQVSESAPGAMSVTVELSEAMPFDVSFNVYANAASSTAVEGADFATVGSIPMNIPAGQLAATFGYQVIDDSIYEFNETIEFGLTPVSNHVIRVGVNGGSIHTATILDDDPQPNIWIQNVNALGQGFPSPSTVGEGTTTWIAVVMSEWSEVPVTGTLSLTGNATYGSSDDYYFDSPLPLNFTIPAGEQGLSYQISLVDDPWLEDPEHFIVTLDNAQYANVTSQSSHHFDIVDPNDADLNHVYFDTLETTLAEGEYTGVQVNFARPAIEDTVIDYSITGTASNGTDYWDGVGPLSGQIIILKDQPFGTIDIHALDEQINEFDETIVLTLTGADFATPNGNIIHTVTIHNNSIQPAIEFVSSTSTVNEEDGQAEITLELDNMAVEEFRAFITVTGGDAEEYVDYDNFPTFIDFHPGDWTRDIIVPLIDDWENEGSEDITITLDSDQETPLGITSAHTLTISDGAESSVDTTVVSAPYVILDSSGGVMATIDEFGNLDLALGDTYARSYADLETTIPGEVALVNPLGETVFRSDPESGDLHVKDTIEEQVMSFELNTGLLEVLNGAQEIVASVTPGGVLKLAGIVTKNGTPDPQLNPDSDEDWPGARSGVMDYSLISTGTGFEAGQTSIFVFDQPYGGSWPLPDYYSFSVKAHVSIANNEAYGPFGIYEEGAQPVYNPATRGFDGLLPGTTVDVTVNVLDSAYEFRGFTFKPASRTMFSGANGVNITQSIPIFTDENEITIKNYYPGVISAKFDWDGYYANTVIDVSDGGSIESPVGKKSGDTIHVTAATPPEGKEVYSMSIEINDRGIDLYDRCFFEDSMDYRLPTYEVTKMKLHTVFRDVITEPSYLQDKYEIKLKASGGTGTFSVGGWVLKDDTFKHPFYIDHGEWQPYPTFRPDPGFYAKSVEPDSLPVLFGNSYQWPGEFGFNSVKAITVKLEQFEHYEIKSKGYGYIAGRENPIKLIPIGSDTPQTEEEIALGDSFDTDYKTVHVWRVPYRSRTGELLSTNHYFDDFADADYIPGMNYYHALVDAGEHDPITATFEPSVPALYTLDLEFAMSQAGFDSYGPGVTATPNLDEYLDGEHVVIEAHALTANNSEGVLKQWVEFDGAGNIIPGGVTGSTANPLEISMTDNRYILASMNPMYQLNIATSGNGVVDRILPVDANFQDDHYFAGTQVTLKAIPGVTNSGVYWEFPSGEISYENPLTIDMQADISVLAVFTGCPLDDLDCDGTPNDDDKCPNNPDPDCEGCAVNDADCDGILDVDEFLGCENDANPLCGLYQALFQNIYLERRPTGAVTPQGVQRIDGTGADPVHLSSGEFVEHVEDMHINLAGPDFSWTRVYRSLHNDDSATGRMGEKWDHSYNMWTMIDVARVVTDPTLSQIAPSDNGAYPVKIRVHNGGEGRSDIWYLTIHPTLDGETAVYYSNNDVQAELNFLDWNLPYSDPAQRLIMTYPDRTTWTYFMSEWGKPGKIEKIRDRHNRGLTFEYDSNDRLTKVELDDDRFVDVNYNGNGLVAGIEDWTGRAIHYGYESSGADDRLMTAERADGTFLTYTYNMDSPADHWLETIRDGNEKIYLRNIYDLNTSSDSAGFVIEQVEGIEAQKLSGWDFSYTFDYQFDSGGDVESATVTDQVGNRKYTEFDADRRVITEKEYISPTSYEFVMTTYTYYSDKNWVKSITRPNDYRIEYEYGYERPDGAFYDYIKERGNVLKATHFDPDAADPSVPVYEESWEYEPGWGNPGINGAFVTEYYDGKGDHVLSKTYTSDGQVETITYDPDGPVNAGINTEHFSYYLDGNLKLHTIERAGNEIYREEFIYDHKGYVLEHKRGSSGSGTTTRTIHDEFGRVESSRDGDYNTTSFTYDPRDRVKTITTPFPATTEYEYDGNGNVDWKKEEYKDENGSNTPNPIIFTDYDYDYMNNLIWESKEIEEGISVVTEWGHDAMSRLLEKRMPAGGKEVYVYGDWGKLFYSQIQASDNTAFSQKSYHYDEFGRLEFVKDWDILGNPAANWDIQVGYEYDYQNRVTVTTDYEDVSILLRKTKILDENGRVEQEIIYGSPPRGSDSKTLTTDFEYDVLGRMTKSKVSAPNIPGSRDTTITYWGPGKHVDTVTDPMGRVTDNDYDLWLRVDETTDANGNSTEFKYDGNDNVTEIKTTEKYTGRSGSKTYTVNNTYDKMALLETTTRALDTTSFEYDSMGNLRVETDPRNHTTRSTYNSFGQMQTRERNGKTMRNKYDDFGYLEEQIDLNGNVTTHLTNQFGWVYQTTFADGTSESKLYDGYGRNWRTIDAEGTTITTNFDVLDRPLSIQWDDGAGTIDSTNYNYGGFGNVIWEGGQHREYNAFGEMKSDGSPSLRTLFEYNDAGEMTKMTYPSGREIFYDRDAIGLVTEIRDPAIGTLATYDYLGRGRYDKKTYTGNGLETDYGYDTKGRVNQIVLWFDSDADDVLDTSELLQQRDFVWDGAGNREQRTVNTFIDGASQWDREHTYGYDSFNQMESSSLVDASVTVHNATYLYDGNGSRTNIDVGPSAGTYNPSNSMHEYPKTPFDSVDRTYDDTGNLASSGNGNYAYNLKNELTSFTEFSQTRRTNVNDGFMRLASASVWDGTAMRNEYYAYAGDHQVEVYTAASGGALLASYVYGPGLDELLHIHTDLDGDGTFSDHYVHADDQNNVTALSDPLAAGGIQEYYYYDDFGTPTTYDVNHQLRLSGVSAFQNKFFFQGRTYDETMKMYNYRARWYSPEIGRFIQRDPLGLYGDPAHWGNPYTYLSNNPWSYVDPYGLAANGNQVDWEHVFEQSALNVGNFAYGIGSEVVGGVIGSAEWFFNEFFHPIDSFNGRADAYGTAYENALFWASEPDMAIGNARDYLADYISGFDWEDGGRWTVRAAELYFFKKSLDGRGKPGTALDSAGELKYYEHTTVGGRSAITDGKYTVNPAAMDTHLPGTAPRGKSVFRSGVDAEKATLDAARFADTNDLWVNGKAKVYVSNGPVGYLGRTGAPTNYINVMRKENGFIHGTPGNPPE